jgi:membrane protein required for colicin V production
VADSAIGPLDRSLGFLYGGARAVLLFVIAGLFFNFFIPETAAPDWVNDSRSKPFLDELGADLLAILPDDPEGQILDRIRGSEEDEATALPDSGT